MGGYRELARANPAAYQPDVARTLNDQATLELLTNNLTRARADVDEALNINRELWKANPEATEDDLARSLAIDAFALNAMHQPASVVCPLLHEAAAVANDPQVKKVVAAEQTEFCSAQ